MIVIRITVALVAVAASTISWAQSSVQTCQLGTLQLESGQSIPNSIKARLLLFPNCYDQLHPPRASGVFDVAEHAPVAKVVNLNDIGGHGGTAPQAALITTEIKSLLGRLEAGMPGIDGPRFPKGASRQDSCSPGGFVQGN